MILDGLFDRRIIPAVIFSALFICIQILPAQSPLDHKSFTIGQSLWISTPQGISLFRSDSRTIRSITLSENYVDDSIIDIAESGGELWVLARSGVYLIDGTSTTVERIPGEHASFQNGKIAVDYDYVWINDTDTLWRFDKLGREWFSYPAVSVKRELCGIYSFESKIINVYSTSVDFFTVDDEKWSTFPNKKGLVVPKSARYFVDKNALVFVTGQTIFRYTIDAQVWDVIETKEPLVDIHLEDTLLVYQTNNKFMQYMTQTSVTRSLDVPNIQSVSCFTKIGDTLYCATDKNFIKYSITSKIADNIDQPPGIADPAINKIISFGGLLLVFYKHQLSIYDIQKKIWDMFEFGGEKKGFKRVVWNDDNGLRANYAGNSYSQLKGFFQQEMKIDSMSGYGAKFFMPIINLTLHNQITSDRYADLFFDNSDKSIVPRKGLFYRGGTQDYIESFRVGTNTIENLQSKTILQSQFEGFSGVLQSKSALKTRDRKVVKVQSGAGMITTRTIYEVLPYQESGIYRLQLAGSSESMKKTIVPGSVKISIDGEEIDTTDYTFSLPTKMLIFNRLDLLDPSSIIKVSYQIRTVPDEGIETVEFVPQYDFGSLGYATVTVSPVDWISPQISYYYLRTDKLHHMISTALPMEIRQQSKGFFLKLNPEITYDATTQRKAIALSVQSRFFDKLTFRYNVLSPDSGYISTDNLNKGYGRLKLDTDLKVQYDIKPELPVSYSFNNIISESGKEQRHEFSANTRFQGFPFADASISRNRVTARMTDTITVFHSFNDSIDSSSVSAQLLRSDSIFTDSIDRDKDKFKIRIFEKQSPFVERLLRINKLSYDVSYTGFTAKKEGDDESGYGAVVYGTGTISPIKSISLTARSLYLKNPSGGEFGKMYTPALILQTIDAPPGIDITARNEINFKSITKNDSSFFTNRRNASLTLKPGKWFEPLSWVQPILSYAQNISCAPDESDPDPATILQANHNVKSKSTTNSVGANFFPTNEIVFRQDNQWTFSDSLHRYYTYNDLKWWFTTKKNLQLRWEFDHDMPANPGQKIKRDYHRGFSYYTSQWRPWIQTMTGLSASYLFNDTLKLAKAGPDVNIMINLQKVSIIRNLINSHNIKMAWSKRNGKLSLSPDIAYSFYLKVIIIPNISIITNTSLVFNESAFSTFTGSLTAMVLF